MDLLAWAERNDCWLIEDDYDGEFRFDARPLAALKSLDRADRVIYFGTFSKVLFPSLRLAYMVVPPGLRQAFVAAKWLSDRGCPAIEQAALARLIGSGAFERHLRAAAKVLKSRRAALLDALNKHARRRREDRRFERGHASARVAAAHAIDAQAEKLVERARGTRTRALSRRAVLPEAIAAAGTAARLCRSAAGRSAGGGENSR